MIHPLIHLRREFNPGGGGGVEALRGGKSANVPGQFWAGVVDRHGRLGRNVAIRAATAEGERGRAGRATLLEGDSRARAALALPPPPCSPRLQSCFWLLVEGKVDVTRGPTLYD